MLMNEMYSRIEELDEQGETEEIKEREKEVKILDDRVSAVTDEVNKVLKDMKATNKSKSEAQNRSQIASLRE